MLLPYQDSIPQLSLFISLRCEMLLSWLVFRHRCFCRVSPSFLRLQWCFSECIQHSPLLPLLGWIRFRCLFQMRVARVNQSYCFRSRFHMHAAIRREAKPLSSTLHSVTSDLRSVLNVLWPQPSTRSRSHYTHTSSIHCQRTNEISTVKKHHL